MLQDFKNIFVNVKKQPQNAKLFRFEKIPKEINDLHISMTVLLITLRLILVNINDLHHHE